MNHLKLSVVAVCLMLGIGFLFIKQNKTKSIVSHSLEDGERKAASIKDALEFDFERTKDLSLGYPPIELMIDALEQTRRMQAEFANSRNTLENNRWKEVGPNNIGGRTRALLIDKNDPNGNTIWAGGVGGGLWKSRNINAEIPVWNKVNDYLENLAIGAIEQDPNDPQVMYLGTGEGYNNGDAIAGLGIFRSIDGGDTWDLLPSTLNNNFRYTQDIFIHPSGKMYAATRNGVYESLDQGVSWARSHFQNSTFYDIVHDPVNELIYASYTTGILKSADNGENWTRISGSTTGFPNFLTRVELAISQSNPEWLYIIGSDDGGASSVYVSTNSGESWIQKARPNNSNGTEFTNGQAWYDLDIAVDPFDPNHVIAGGVIIMRSTNGGSNWERFANNMHVDQHFVLFDPDRANVVYFGNDGGVYRSENGSAAQVQNRNNGYNITQFYACAIHPEPFKPFYLGGTQDNSSLLMERPGITSARNVKGGDGAFCHIDEDEPHLQMVSSQNSNYAFSTNGGVVFGRDLNLGGSFISPSDYDSESNIMYAEYNQGVDTNFFRVKLSVNTLLAEPVQISGFAQSISTIYADPNTSNRIYIGTNVNSNQVLRIDNAHDGNVVEATALAGISGHLSSFDIELGDAQHILATVSNFGSISVYESKDGGSTWINVEGNLPNMPVRWGVFNPNNSAQAMVATEAGVWVTEELDGSNTVWIPPAEGKGTPLVRVDMLQVRQADGTVLAATHGRGMFVSDLFSEPGAKGVYERVGYTDSDQSFYGGLSTQAESYLWDFGDGTTSQDENPSHSFDNIGIYPVRLTINNAVSEEADVKILPDVALPYLPGKDNYGGDFESKTEQYGVHTISGSAFERGKSSVNGKSGAHSGENAFVVGLEENFYQPGTHTMLYLPNFDFSDESIYEFSFWAKYRLQAGGQDGFLIEYSNDRGKSWSILGSDTDENWYNFRSDNSADNSAFPSNTPFFAGNSNNWKQFTLDMTSFSGQGEIAFRIVFKSEYTGSHIGLAIDDVEISKFEGELITKLTSFRGEFSGPTEITINWNTSQEYRCKEFELERSFNGRDFNKIESVDATGGTSVDPQVYEVTTLGERPVLFYRLKVINAAPSVDYLLEFYSDTIVLSREPEVVKIFQLFPNPFTNYVEMTFTNLLEEPVNYELYDSAGRIVQKGSKVVNGAFGRLDFSDGLPIGVYFLSVQIGDREPEEFKLLKAL